jgi:hypothetical protein
MAYGPLGVNRHRLLRARGLDLRVFVRGVDVTTRCRYADDTVGAQIAVLYRHNEAGHCYLDEDGQASVEIADDEVLIRPEALEP